MSIRQLDSELCVTGLHQCLLTDTGVDVAIKGAGRTRVLERAMQEQLSQAAYELDLARLSVDGEPIVERTKPVLRMGRASVTPPPGAFLQATAKGEEILSQLLLDAITGASRVVDLFAGIGTFALRAAESAEVLAVESDVDMLAALKRAADGAGGALKQVSVLRRDLLRTPLSNLEMKKFHAAIIDPPRSGARLQAEQIARAPIRRLAYVSCDPGSELDGQGALTGSDPGNVIGWFPGGSAFYSHSVSDKFKVGIGAYGNFGLAMDFGDSWAGKNLVGEMSLIAMTIQPRSLPARRSLVAGCRAVCQLWLFQAGARADPLGRYTLAG